MTIRKRNKIQEKEELTFINPSAETKRVPKQIKSKDDDGLETKPNPQEACVFLTVEKIMLDV